MPRIPYHCLDPYIVDSPPIQSLSLASDDDSVPLAAGFVPSPKEEYSPVAEGLVVLVVVHWQEHCERVINRDVHDPNEPIVTRYHKHDGMTCNRTPERQLHAGLPSFWLENRTNRVVVSDIHNRYIHMSIVR